MSSEFLSWHDEFTKKHSVPIDYDNRWLKQYGVKPDYRPNMQEWIDLVDKNHEKLREKLGGVSRTYKINFKTEETLASYYTVYDRMTPILNILPDYLTKYNLTIYDFQRPKLTKCNNIAGTKHILGYAKRIKLDEEKTKELQKFVEKLGQLWAKYKPGSDNSYVTISTDPKAFCLIGRLQIDNESCFGQGRFNSDKKYTLGAHKNTFVALYHRDADYKLEDGSDSFTARSQGIMTGDDLNILNIFNHYPQDSGSVLQKMRETAKDYLKTQSIGLAEGRLILKGGINYPEYSYQSLTYFDSEKPVKSTQVVQVDNRYSKESHSRSDLYAI